jgi:hypothetical protein
MTLRSPFRVKTSPEVIGLAVMLYIRFPLSLRNVEDGRYERGDEIGYEIVRYWFRRFWRIRTLQKFATVYATVHNHFSTERYLQNRHHCMQSRSAALPEWRGLIVA